MVYRVWQGVILVFVVVLQTTLLHYVASPSGIKPDLILIIVVYFGVSRGTLEGEVIGFLSGLLEDAFSGGAFGINALSKTMIGFLSGAIKKYVYFENIICEVAIIATATLIDTSLKSLIKFMIYARPQIDIWIFPIEVLYNTLIGIFVFQVLLMIKRMKEQKGQR